MSVPNKYDPPSNTPLPLPLCPHCKAELATVSLFNWQFGAWIILAVFCPACRFTLHYQIVPVQMPAEAPRIAVPS